MTQTNTHETQNLYEASFLLCKGFRLAGKKQHGNKVLVLFEGQNVHEEALRFYNGAKVEAKALTDAYRTLKDYIFER